MKNESGTKEDISMLDALQRLWHHKAKRKPIVFVVTFPDVSRKVTSLRSGAEWTMTGNTSSRTASTRLSLSMENARWSRPSWRSPA